MILARLRGENHAPVTDADYLPEEEFIGRALAQMVPGFRESGGFAGILETRVRGTSSGCGLRPPRQNLPLTTLGRGLGAPIGYANSSRRTSK